MKKRHFLSLLITGIFVLLATGTGDDDGDSSSQTGKQAAPPDSPQARFVAKMAEFEERYDDAPNELKGSKVFKEARKFDKQFFGEMGHELSDWRGTLTDIDTPKGGGEVWVEIDVGPATFTQGSDIGDEGVPEGSSIYEAIGELSEDQCVVFSAQVDPEEQSTSEGGAMRNPEYQIELSQIGPCK